MLHRGTTDSDQIAAVVAGDKINMLGLRSLGRREVEMTLSSIRCLLFFALALLLCTARAQTSNPPPAAAAQQVLKPAQHRVRLPLGFTGDPQPGQQIVAVPGAGTQ